MKNAPHRKIRGIFLSDTKPVGASLLAMVVNDNALNQMPSGAYGFFASRLAPTGVCVRQ
ncbi:hypothetical protein PG5_25030 [Pseudomonas sp. G5(2012)]|nr:hypothetical protein PG5_25030 [Pseudomonas sp. G5(2012)]